MDAALAFARDRLGLLRAVAGREDDAAELRILGRRVVVLATPTLARALLVEAQRSLTKSPVLRQARVVLGEGLLTAEGSVHRRHRRLVQPAFHRSRVATYGAAMTAAAAEEAARWRAGQTLDAGAAMHRVALRIAGATLLAADTRARADEVRAAMDDLLAAYPTALLPFGAALRRLPLPQVRRLRAGLARIDALVAEVVADRRARPADGDDLLGMLLAARDEDGSALSDAEVRDEVVTLLLAGHETTATALTWALHLLAAHPEAQDRVHAEVAGLPADPVAADLDGLPATRAVLAEALRLYPPSWAIAREAVEDVGLGPVALRAGDIAIASPWVLHRDPRWWVAPERFAPERWDGVDPRRPYAPFLPFGAGTRRCVGEGFAWAEGTLVLATLLRRWALAAAGPLPRPVPTLTLRPGPAAPLRLVPQGAWRTVVPPFPGAG